MMMDHFISRLFQGTLHVDKIHVQFKIANITNALPVSSPLVDRFHTETGNRNFVPERDSRPGTTTGVTRAGMKICGDIT